MTSGANSSVATSGELEADPARSGAGGRARRAAGLVPVSDEKSKLETKVDEFVADLVAQDANSPEFGHKVDQITNMGRKEIMPTRRAMSNRFLDRPVRAMDKDSGVGADLAELRRTVEDLDPGQRGQAVAPRKLFGIIPFGNKLRDYFDSYNSAQGHIRRSSPACAAARTSC